MVERFDLDEGGFLGERGRMVPDEFGDYVRVADYAALEDRFVARIEDYETTIARLQEQLETVTKERDTEAAFAAVRAKYLKEAEAERDRLRGALTQISLAPMFVTTDRDRWIDWAVETAEAALQKEPQP